MESLRRDYEETSRGRLSDDKSACLSVIEDRPPPNLIISKKLVNRLIYKISISFGELIIFEQEERILKSQRNDLSLQNLW